jgi:hypothetical protein
MVSVGVWYESEGYVTREIIESIIRVQGEERGTKEGEKKGE